jgi:hypothetical protein
MSRKHGHGPRQILVEVAAKIGFLRRMEGQTQQGRIKNTKLII